VQTLFKERRKRRKIISMTSAHCGIVPAPVHLIAMKLHATSSNADRELKDFPDVIQLIKLCEIDPSDDEIKILFQKYSLMSLYDKTIEILKKH
jgi:hypothetical protein